MSLLWTAAKAISDSPSGYPTRVVHMPVDELVVHADPTRMTDEGPRRNVEELAESFRQHGYQPRKHNGMDQWGRYSYAQPIHLTLTRDHGPQLMNGNHRAWAAQMAGLTHVPVVVTDMRGEPQR